MLKRLQGKNWHQEKDKYRLLYTYTSDRGNIKGVYQEIDGKKREGHWMNNEEKQAYLKVGDFARTIDGQIFKIKGVRVLGSTINDVDTCKWFKSRVKPNEAIFCEQDFMYEDGRNQIELTSKDLLDLLQIRDLLYVDISPDDCGGIVVPRIAETQAELDKFKKLIRKGTWHLVGIVPYECLFDNMQCIELKRKVFGEDTYETIQEEA